MTSKLLILLSLTGWILSEAISEGMYDDKKKFWSKIVQSGTVIFPFIIIWIFTKDYHLPVIYLIVRILFFSMAYNITRGLSHNYIGTTDWYDKYIAKYMMLAPVWWGILFFLIIFTLKWIRP